MPASLSIETKIARLIDYPKSKPKVLDLFAGCGGLSLGFESAGCEIVAAVENDPIAAQTHANNFFADSLESLAHHATARDITTTEPEEIVSEFGLGDVDLAVDIIVGGPPCQAYARVGRAKLREISEHPKAFKIDARANLYLRYLHFVKRLKPLALLMENVPDILNFGGHNVVQEIVEALDDLGYDAAYSLINAAHHSVPQMRDRVFLIGLRKELMSEVRFPAATTRCELPSGYKGTRAVALKLIDRLDCANYIEPDTGHEGLSKAVTAFDAIGDLPKVTEHLVGKLKRGTRRFTTLAAYRNISSEKLSDFARLMRTWPNRESHDGVYDHVLRYLPRDIPIFKRMKEGDEYPAARKVAEQIFQERARRRGLKTGTAAWAQLREQIVPPYDPSKFPNRWWKLRKNKPVRTLTAHIGKDTYTHIHYDSAQARVITVREAARLQSFPDGFVFSGTMNPAFRQIGNAVPPLLARTLAAEILATLRSSKLAEAAE